MSLFRSTSLARRLAALLLSIALSALAIPGAALAQGAKADSAHTIHQNGAKILDYGIYRHNVLGYTKAPNDISGQRFTAGNVRLIRKTQTILAQLNLTFGFRYRVTDPALLGKELQIVVRFPKMTNPANGKTGTQLIDSFVATGVERRELFRFDYTWEMAEGRWTFQVLDGKRVVVEIPFRVIVGLN